MSLSSYSSMSRIGRDLDELSFPEVGLVRRAAFRKRPTPPQLTLGAHQWR
jgi:hypothetical protein